MKTKKRLFLTVWFVLIIFSSIAWAGFVDPPNIPKNWSAANFLNNKSPLAIATASDPGTVIVWAERDSTDNRNMKIYGTLWGGSKTLIGTVDPEEMNADPCPQGYECGTADIQDIEITSQPVHDGTRNCFYVAVLVYDQCPLCLDQELASRTETWVKVYKLYNNSGALQSIYMGRFGVDTSTPTLIREYAEGVPVALRYSTKIHDVAIEKAVYSGNTYVNLYYTYSYYWEDHGDPYFYLYQTNVYSSVSGSSSLISSWDEDCDTGMACTSHYVSAAFDDYSDRIWLVWNHMNENCTIFNATVAKMSAVGNSISSSWASCKSNIIECRITSDNNTASSRLAMCWKDTSDNKIKASLITDSGVGSTIQVSENSTGDCPDISYINSGYFAIVYGSGAINITRWYSSTPDAIYADIEIAKNQVISGLNPTRDNRYPRIATYPGTNSGEFYVVWKGLDSASSGKIIGKHSATTPFRTRTYYCYLGYQITKITNPTFSPNWSSIIANDSYGDYNKRCEMEFNTSSFASGDQVYYSKVRAYLSSNSLTWKTANMRLLDNPYQFSSGSGLVDLANSSEGTGWTDWKIITDKYNYFERRPNGYDYFFVWVDDPTNPQNQAITITISSNRPQLYLYYIDWQP